MSLDWRKGPFSVRNPPCRNVKGRSNAKETIKRIVSTERGTAGSTVQPKNKWRIWGSSALIFHEPVEEICSSGLVGDQIASVLIEVDGLRQT